jgi:hypothetical protein
VGGIVGLLREGGGVEEGVVNLPTHHYFIPARTTKQRDRVTRILSGLRTIANEKQNTVTFHPPPPHRQATGTSEYIVFKLNLLYINSTRMDT